MSVTYNGQSFPQGVTPPFVSISDEPIFYGEKWGVLERVVLTGTIVDCDSSELVNKKLQVASMFSSDHKTLNVDGGKFVRNYVTVDSINFETSRYFGSLPFSINLTCYPSDYFSLSENILNPVNEWTFQETDDSTVVVTHRVEATGIQGANSALDNARSFVDSNRVATSNVNTNLAQYINVDSNKTAVLTTENETVDRLSARVTLVRTYVFDQLNNHNGIFRYLVDRDETLGEFVQVSISGSYSGGLEADFGDMRDEIKSIDFHNIATSVQADVYDTPLEKTFQENESENTITFSLRYNNDPNLISVSSDVEITDEEDGGLTVSISGEVSGRGDLKSKYENVESYFENSLDIFSIAQSSLNLFDSDIQLNSNPVSYTYSKNKFTGKISFSASYTDRPNIPEEFDELSFTININPSLQKITNNHVVNQGSTHLEMWDLDYHTRGKVSISGHGVVKEGYSVQEAIKSISFEINNALDSYVRFVSIEKESASDGYSINGERIDFSTEWSFESQEPINSSNFMEVIFR